MKHNNLTWHGIELINLLPVLLQLRSAKSKNLSSAFFLSPDKSLIRIGIPQETGRRFCPVVVVSDAYVNEFFAWLYTFAEEAMPLSMYCKLLKLSDYEEFGLSAQRSQPVYPERWSSIIVGEIMFRSGSERVLGETPASWTLLTYSFAASLAHENYRDCIKQVINIFNQRLESLPNSESPSRSELINSLHRVWDVYERSQKFDHTPKEAIVYSLKLLMESSSRNQHLTTGEWEIKTLISDLLNSTIFENDSLEKRVVAFDEIVSMVNSFEKPPFILSGFAIAAAALLVGRGISHVHLLDGQANKSSFLWISLFAGLCGEKFWDSRWITITKKIETLTHFYAHGDPLEATLADLSWIEYYWISQSKNSISQLSIIPKIKPHFLTIEILPSVPLEIRLSRSEKVNQNQAVISSEIEVNRLLASKLEDLARELRKQSSLFLDSHYTKMQHELALDEQNNLKKSRKGKR